ncbi:MAG TPA: hypothetical protein VEC12_03745 [Bacteroidia bacterium]|nr:hypothetical protein [Bacteroidia bacterium]
MSLEHQGFQQLSHWLLAVSFSHERKAKGEQLAAFSKVDVTRTPRASSNLAIGFWPLAFSHERKAKGEQLTAFSKVDVTRTPGLPTT